MARRGPDREAPSGAEGSDIGADLSVGPTTLGMVRIHIRADDGTDLPLDFDPDEAEDIAEELKAAAEAAREIGARPPAGGGAGPNPPRPPKR
jgi:hypothetical protein